MAPSHIDNQPLPHVPLHPRTPRVAARDSAAQPDAARLECAPQRAQRLNRQREERGHRAFRQIAAIGLVGHGRIVGHHIGRRGLGLVARR